MTRDKDNKQASLKDSIDPKNALIISLGFCLECNQTSSRVSWDHTNSQKISLVM